MKSVLTVLCLLASALLLISCSGESTDTKAEATATAEHAEHPAHTEHPAKSEHPTAEHPGSEAHTHATADDNLVLNDGQKWQMDDHTRASFADMAGAFRDVDATALDTEGLKAAGADLMTDLKGLISGCTMTGEDHDQLHVYLTAYIPAVTELEKSGELKTAQEVQHYLSIYADYFE